MTAEIPQGHERPPDGSILKPQERKTKRLFPDYALPSLDDDINNNNLSDRMSVDKLAGVVSPTSISPLSIVPDHTLASDWNIVISSPAMMYESDPLDSSSSKALLSPTISDTLHSPVSTWKCDTWDQPREESIDLNTCAMPFWGQFDGPPLQDYLSDFISGPDGTTIKAIGDELVALTNSVSPDPGEEPLRKLNSAINVDGIHNGLKEKGSQGPTLAQLNDRESVLDPVFPGNATSTPSTWSGDLVTRLSASVSHTDTSTTTASNWAIYKHQLSTQPANNNNIKTVSGPSRPSSSATLASSGLAGSSHDQLSDNFNESQYSCSASDLTYKQSHPAPMAVLNKQPEQQFTLQSENTRKGTSLQALLSEGQLQKAQDSPSPEVVLKPPARKRKRSGSPNTDSNHSSSSMERKWEEIRAYIDSNIKAEYGDEPETSEMDTTDPMLQKIKVEPQDPDGCYDLHDDTAMSIKEEYDSDMDNSDFSDAESDASYSSFIDDILHGTGKKEKRYFWQYNTQSKGPKGKRLCKSVQEVDPHLLADFEDPVFLPDMSDARYKHNGKARKGDGNDITPNPWKLFQIGNELMKLNKKINCIGAQEKPVRSKDGVKSKSRKEKNKFASRACRLKKKAQHEANKLKLFGLEQEHHQLIEVLKEVKRKIYSCVKSGVIEPGESSFTSMMETCIKNNLTAMIAGNTSEYVNTVLEKIAAGDKTGGIYGGEN